MLFDIYLFSLVILTQPGHISKCILDTKPEKNVTGNYTLLRYQNVNQISKC